MAVMFTKRTTVVIFAIVTALALVTAGSYASSAVALGHHKQIHLRPATVSLTMT
jgi:hypothetical protein